MFIMSKALVALGFRPDLAGPLNGSGAALGAALGAGPPVQLPGRSHRSDHG
jgi:hypothetical protein